MALLAVVILISLVSLVLMVVGYGIGYALNYKKMQRPIKLVSLVHLSRGEVKELALANNFKLKVQPDGSEDLNPYVYDFAQALIDRSADKSL